MKPRRVGLQFLGFAVILVTCTGTWLAGVYNRGGVPESALRLSDRELELPTADESGKQENVPLTFRLAWRVESADEDDSAVSASSIRAAWITRSKLAQLDIPISSRVRRNTLLSTLLVLEFDGPAHARAVSRACYPATIARDERLCDLELNKASRLYIVDAGRTVTELRGRYPDRAHFAVVAGVIKLSQDSNTGEPMGYVGGLSVDTIQGMEPLRSTIDPATGEMLWHRQLVGHFFDAVIAFGRRLEPWNISIEGRKSEAVGPAAIPQEGAEWRLSIPPR